MKRSHLAFSRIVVGLWLGVSIAAQQPPAFRSETRLVVVEATVKNSRGELLTNLSQSAFTVYENGTPQPIILFRANDTPVSVGILIDNSGSMRPVRSRVEAAALAFARASNPDDELFVVNFADRAHLDVPLTTDRQTIERRIARVDSIGGTAMRDAIVMATTYLRDQAKWDRRVLLVITDGNDNASTIDDDGLRQVAEQSGIAIFGMALLNGEDASKAKRAHHELDQLAQRTGGVVAYPVTIEAVDAVAVDLARRIRHQYVIGYAPVNQVLDGSYRRIQVRVTARQKVVIQTRPGYWATASGASPPTRR